MCRGCEPYSKDGKRTFNQKLVLKMRTVDLGYIDCSPEARLMRAPRHLLFATGEIEGARRLVGDPGRPIFGLVFAVSTTTTSGTRDVRAEGYWNGSISSGCIYLGDPVTKEWVRNFTAKEMEEMTVTCADGTVVKQPVGKLVMDCRGYPRVTTDTEHDLECGLDEYAVEVDDAFIPLWWKYQPVIAGAPPHHVGFRALIGEPDGSVPGSRDGLRAYVRPGWEKQLAWRIERYGSG